MVGESSTTITHCPWVFILPHIFLQKSQNQWFKHQGIQVLKYLDDFPSGAPSFLLQCLYCHYVVEHMLSIGRVLKAAKLLGYPDPLPEILALGIIVFFSAQQF